MPAVSNHGGLFFCWEFFMSGFANFFTTDLGIAGLVASGLMSLLAFVITASNRKDTARIDSFQNAMNRLYTLHQQERNEWREDAVKRDAEWRREIGKRDKEVSTALNELTKAIHEIMLVREK
jgi:hypothetical protein